MEMTLIEKAGQTRTRIKCGVKDYPRYESTIMAYIAMYGGKQERRNARNIYFIVNADLLGGR